MAISIDQLVQSLSKEEVLDALLALLKAAKFPVTAWQPGEPVLALLEKISEWFAALWDNVIVKAIRAGFLEYAEGDWLTLLAWVAYGVLRNAATFAGRSITIENHEGGVWNFFPGDVRIKNEAGKTFSNVTGGSLAAFIGSGDYPTVTMDFLADEAGSGSNTAVGGIQTILVEGPAGVFARTNDAPFYGDDEEGDVSLRERCRLSTGPLSPGGPKAAYESIARSAKRADGTNVDVTRVRIVQPGGSELYAYLAGANGATTGDTLTEGSDVYITNQALQLYADPWGITLYVEAASEVLFARTITLTIDRAANLSESAAKTRAAAAVGAYFRTLKVGGARLMDGGAGYVVATEVAAKASESAQGIIKAVCSGDDLELAINEVAVESITYAVVFAAQE